MKINQLFITYIDDTNLINDLLSCFNSNSLQNTCTFSLDEMKKNGSLNYFNTFILDRLKIYYLPCKAHVYLVDVTEKKMITILRQVLKMFNYKLITTKKTTNKCKSIIYSIQDGEFTKKKLDITNKSSTIKFD